MVCVCCKIAAEFLSRLRHYSGCSNVLIGLKYKLLETNLFTKSVEPFRCVWFFSLPSSFFFFERQCSSFFRDRKKKSMINKRPALRNNPEITDWSVCVTEEESVCGEKSSYHLKTFSGQLKGTVQRTWLAKGQFHVALWRPWNLSPAGLHPLSLCGQLSWPHLTDTEQMSLSLSCSMGTEDQPPRNRRQWLQMSDLEFFKNEWLEPMVL